MWDRTGGNDFLLEFRRDIGKEFFPGGVGRGWAGIPRGAVAAPSLGVPKVQCALVGGVPAHGTGWALRSIPAFHKRPVGSSLCLCGSQRGSQGPSPPGVPFAHGLGCLGLCLLSPGHSLCCFSHRKQLLTQLGQPCHCLHHWPLPLSPLLAPVPATVSCPYRCPLSPLLSLPLSPLLSPVPTGRQATKGFNDPKSSFRGIPNPAGTTFFKEHPEGPSL